MEHAPTATLTVQDPLDVAHVYAEHAEFVWLTLQRLGVRPADLEDVLHDVFIVVHRKQSTFDRTSTIRTWLFGVCLRVAAAYRRRAWVRRERPSESVCEAATHGQGPEEQAANRQALRHASAALDTLSLEHRAVLVMFELDGVGCATIAEMLGVPLGTVHSRLAAARKAFQCSLLRIQGGGR